MTKGDRWTRRSTLFAGAVLALSLSGCFKHTYHVGGGAPTGTVVVDQWRNHWIGGIVSPDHELALDQVCPSGNATVDEEMSFLNGLVAALTSGIYAPTSVRVRCVMGSADLDFDAEDVEAAVTDPSFLEWVEAVSPELLDEAAEAQQLLREE